MAVLDRLSAKDVKKYGGKWVAVKGSRVLTSADDPSTVVTWLKEHDAESDLVYRVPAENEPSSYY